MINARNFMEFFEKECNVQFIDQKTGRRALNIIAEEEAIKKLRSNDVQSDYDRFLAECGDDDD